jgi:hypothetical protein
MQLFGHLANLLAFDSEDAKLGSTPPPANPLVDDASAGIPGLPEIAPALPPMGGSGAFAPGSQVRDILSGREGTVQQGPEGDFGNVVFVMFDDGKTIPMRGDQLESAPGGMGLPVPTALSEPAPLPADALAVEPPMGEEPLKEDGEKKEKVKSSLEVKAEPTAKNIASNQTEVEVGDTIIFFSYNTPVAAFIPGEGYVVTDRKWSVTTSKHVSQWLSRHGVSRANVSTVPQTFLDDLDAGGVQASLKVKAVEKNIGDVLLDHSDYDDTDTLFTIEDKGTGQEMADKYPEAWENTKTQMSPDMYASFLEEPAYYIKYDGIEDPYSIVGAPYVEDLPLGNHEDLTATKKTIASLKKNTVRASQSLIAGVTATLKAQKAPAIADLVKALGAIPANWDTIRAGLDKAGIKLAASALPKGWEKLGVFEKKVILLSAGHSLKSLQGGKPTVPRPKDDPGPGKTWAWDQEKFGWYAADAVTAGSVKITVDPETGKKSWRHKTKEEGNPFEPVVSHTKCPACGGLAKGGICETCGQDVQLGKSLHKMFKDFGAFGSLKANSDWANFGDSVEKLLQEKSDGKVSLERPWSEGMTTVHELQDWFKAGMTPEAAADKILAAPATVSAAKKDETTKGPLESIKHKKRKAPIQPYKKLDKEFKKTEVKNTAEVKLDSKED